MIRSLLFAAAALALPATAHAAAYTMPKGEGRVILNTYWSTSDKAYDNDGRPVDIPDYDKIEIYALTEYGLTDDLTLIVTPSLRRVSIADGGDDSTGLGYTDVGARYRLARGKGWVISAEGKVRIPGQRRRENFAQIGSTDTEYDARAQAGIDLGENGRNGYVIVEAGYRWRDGDPPNEFHIDATLGLRVAPRFTVMAQSFNTISDGQGRGVFRDHRYHNAYVSGVYDVSEKVSVQLGAYGTVAGENALRERGLFAGLWFRF